MLTRFLLIMVFLFVLVPLTAEEKRMLKFILASTSNPGVLPSVVKLLLQELRRKEVLSATLEIGMKFE